MPSITYDGQSFMIDGRRIWLVSGSIHYARVPRELWAARIHAAKQAGLNTIETPVFWARHEPRHGKFDFTGDNDIRRFVELIAQAGMYCILRPGPYVGTGWDMGGLPPWLLGVPNIQLRTASQPFLEACSRYITAVSQQVRDLQATSPGQGGPIILIQNEAAWTCGHDTLAHSYLGELNRYYRESGLTVPTINANDLWQAVESQIDAWTGFEDLLSHLRQLAAIAPERPRLVIEFRSGGSDVWGRPEQRSKTPRMILRRLGEVLAAGGQYNITPFHGGTNFGFSGGRLAGLPDAYITTSSDRGAPVTEVGAQGPVYGAVRRISTFASRFGRILSNLDHRRQSVNLHPNSTASGGGLAVVYQSGPQGGVAFVFGDEAGSSKSQRGTLLLPDGSFLPIDLGKQPVGWYLFDARLSGRSHLDYLNLCALANIGRVLVCFGPAGSRAVISINGSPVEAEVPSGKHPLLLEHEGVALLIASDEQVDTIYFSGDSIYTGVLGITREGEAIPHPEYKQYTRLSADGVATNHRTPAPVVKNNHAAPTSKRPRGVGAPAERLVLADWACAPASDYTRGESARYATITGPADLGSLGSPYGYGWYRLRVKAAVSRKHRILFPHSGDRLHVFVNGEAQGVAGHGPGAAREVHAAFHKGPGTLVVLAENLGRPSAGVLLGQSVGLVGHGWAVAPIKTEKPRVVHSDPVDLLAFKAPLWHINKGDTTDAARMTWTLAHRRKTPVFVLIAPLDGSGIVLLNGTPIRYFERGSDTTITLEPDRLSRGNNLIQIAMVGGTEAHSAALAHAVTFLEGAENLTAKADWAFARWEPPPPDAYLRSAKREALAAGPVWWRSTFTADDSETPLMLDVTGMTKGQIYVNNRHIGRYFRATADGAPVPPQARYFIPRPWVESGVLNELMLFDEHGGNAAACRLIADENASAFGE